MLDESLPTLVGEANPYGSEEHYALYPNPVGSAGYRLCCTILGMYQYTYLRMFNRVNLVYGRWRIADARFRALSLSGRLIILGRKPCDAFGIKYAPFTISGDRLILPHPSGLCRLWNEPGSYERARQLVAEFYPAVAPLLGVVLGNAEPGGTAGEVVSPAASRQN